MTTSPSPDVPIRAIVERATRAPSVHNTQPWRWCVDGDRLSLFADSSRQLKYADPDGRDLILSCGAALHHLHVVAAGSGWKARVRRMPTPYNDNQVADISFSPQVASPEAVAALEALSRRRTDRRRPAAWPVPRLQLDRLVACGPPAGVTVAAVVSTRARTELRQVLAEAERAQREDPQCVDEIVRWTGREDAQGIPVTNLVRRSGHQSGQGAPSRFPSGTLADHPPAGESVQPAMLVICASSDDTASRLRAGEALGAVLVEGTAAGLMMVPLSQATEVERTRLLLKDELLDDAACPQILVQVGWPPGDAPEVPATPRRPVEEVLGDVASLPPWMGPYVAPR